MNLKVIQIVISVSILFLLLVYPLFVLDLITAETSISLLLGIGLPFLNFLLGFLSIKYSINETHSFFLIVFLGGMVFRLFLMLLVVFLILKFLENIAYSFIFIIFIFYSFYLLSEIIYLIQLKNK